jgi:predicted CXXCH cytochrome family protein
MKRMNGTLAAPLRAHWSRRFAAISLVAAPILTGAWLFTAAFPVLADGGPHVVSVNSGSGTGSTLTADSCAGCHRAHTAQGPLLINAPDEEALCFTCHSTTGTGATTDVVSGVQYKAPLSAQTTAPYARTGSVLGALRSGGFVQARIASSTPARVFRSGSAANVWGKVSVGAPQDVTSAHLNLTENGLTAPTVAWGNGAISATANAGPTVSITCATCHNPHGNGQYRILNPVPDPDATAGVFVPVAAPGASVTDAALPGAGDARNYTVIQGPGPSFLLSASQVASSGTSGDYWHLRVPWNSQGGNPDAPNGIPYETATALAFETEMTAWCSSCHTRYYSVRSSPQQSGDLIFKFRHQTVDAACTTCHVAHGSNAQMPGNAALGTNFSGNFPYPAAPGATATTSGSSRLLKVDNRGTCQMCHDPTGTMDTNPIKYSGPLPTPGVP